MLDGLEPVQYTTYVKPPLNWLTRSTVYGFVAETDKTSTNRIMQSNSLTIEGDDYERVIPSNSSVTDIIRGESFWRWDKQHPE